MSLHAECVDTATSAETIFLAAFARSESSFWLDSSLAEAGRARFPSMGDASGPRTEVLTYWSASRELVVRRGAAVQTRSESIFDYLRDRIPERQPTGPALPFDFVGGFVGYFGYELKQELGGRRMHDAATPDAMWMLADHFLAFDRAEQQVWRVVLDGAEPGGCPF